MRKYLYSLLWTGASRWAKLAVAAVFVLLVFGSAGVAMAAGQVAKNGDDHLITIYDDGTERTILTHAKTVADALRDAKIATDTADDIEPKLNAKLTDTSTNINIYRARPVVVVDGSRQIRVVTPAQSNSEIAKAAGLTLDPADETDLSRVDDVLASGGAGLELTIKRAKTVNLRLYGQNVVIKTQAKTVAALLKEKNIKLGPNDGANLPLDTPITDRMNLQVWRNGSETITENETVAFETETINDSTKEQGSREVRTPGQNGEKKVVYQIEIRDGQEISREKISEIITTPPVTEVVVVGTKVSGPTYNANGSHEEWMRAAGIAEENFPYVEFLVSRESGWNPNAVNRSSGACGLPQALPCSKLGPNWNNPVVALSWMNGYVGRYGGWAGAYAFWQSHHWY